MEIQTVAIMNTIYNADCIDFCPIETLEHILIVGTYELVNNSEKCESSDESTCDNNTDKRVGCLYLLSLEEKKLKILQQIQTPGILDVRWCTHKVNEKIVAGAVDAEGRVTVYSLEKGNHLEELCSAAVTSNLALYVDWSTALTAHDTPLLTISDSKGFINIFSLGEKDIKFVQKFKAHDFEAWVTSFNYWKTTTVYTGGDDCKFKGYDIRANAAQMFSSNAHTVGVTAIQHSLWKETLVFSGCYEGKLNAWDIRNMKFPVSETNLGGGIWRLRSEPFCKPLMLASTMHNGFHILEVDKHDQPEIIGTYSKHKSLAYGADWSRVSKGSKYLLGSVSFYDKLLSLWEFVY